VDRDPLDVLPLGAFPIDPWVVLLWTPNVMISSTISELAGLRQEVGDLVEAGGLATAWLFEEHAAAAGSPASEQYLGEAKACDLYVLIVANQHSEATEAEYNAAYNDNPEKVLPFFLGEGTPDVTAFRSLIEERHTRVERKSNAELITAIATTIQHAVETGSPIRPTLLADLDARIERARTAIADVPMLFEPRLAQGSNDMPPRIESARSVLQGGCSVALTGIGGSGKTMAALISMRRAAGDHRTLPIYANITDAITDPTEAIRQRLEASRFRASVDLIDRWAAEGRIFLVADAIENLTPVARRSFMTNVAAWVDRYPRCGFAVCARRFTEGELVAFQHWEAARLGPAELDLLADCLEIPRIPTDTPPQLRELAGWPMWATALMVYGTGADTGLQLLNELVRARFTTAGMSSPLEVEELKAAASYLAFAQWPATSSPLSEVLDHLSAWSSSHGAARFTERPAADLLHRLAESGLIESGDIVEFLHRLFATLLAAEHIVAEQSPTVATVPAELAPFVCALADDDHHVTFLNNVLSVHDVFVLASFLRLSPPREREHDLEGDSKRMSETFQLLSDSGERLEGLARDSWIAWRPTTSHQNLTFSTADYDSWRAGSNRTIHLWPVNPLTLCTPEFMAGVVTLAEFRERVLSLSPAGDPYDQAHPERVGQLLRDHSRLRSEILGTVHARRELELEYLSRLGLRASELVRPPAGEPRITIWATSSTDATLNLAWGAAEPSVEIRSGPNEVMDGINMQLGTLLNGQDQAVAYDTVSKRIASALGARLTARSWKHPLLVPAMSW